MGKRVLSHMYCQYLIPHFRRYHIDSSSLVAYALIE